MVLHLALIIWAEEDSEILLRGGDGSLAWFSVSWGRGCTGRQSLFCVGSSDNGSCISVEVI